MDIDKVLKKRASIRKYSNKPVSMNQILDCVEAATLAPCPGNFSAIKFILIKDIDQIKEITKAAQQPFLEQASNIIIVCSDKTNCEKLYGNRADKYIEQYVGAVIENMLLKITDLGLVSCWIGAFSDITIKRILKIPDNMDIKAIIPIAYQHKTNKEKQKPKSKLKDVLYFEEWKNKEYKKTKMIRN